PLYVLVGANSPSLCPTMSSVTYTGTCLRPSYTAIVCPMKLGKIVERRDHVLITLFLLLSLFASTFFMRCPSTKGPFLRLRAIWRLLPIMRADLSSAHYGYFISYAFLRSAYQSGFCLGGFSCRESVCPKVTLVMDVRLEHALHHHRVGDR